MARTSHRLLSLPAFALLGGLALSAAAAEPISVPPADFPRPAKPSMGVNLESPTDFSRTMLFVDTIKSARKFGSPNTPWDGNAPVDSHGWPTSDAGAVIMAGLPVPAGDYSFSCTGKCAVALVNTNGSVHKLAYDPKTNTTTATVTIDPNNQNFFINFTKTDGGIKNIRLIRPGYAPSTTEVFTREFLTALAPFSAMRLMDFTKTNETDVQEWVDRPKPDDAIQTSTRGVAWEYGIMLANQTKKDLWINVPDRASDDYIRQLAKLLQEKLDKDRNVYIEYSNEVWNFGFTQANRNLEAAKAEVAAGDKTLSDDGQDTNQYYWGWKRVSKKLLQIGSIFKDVFGADAINTRIRPVLASQSAQVFVARMQVDYIAHHFGPPANFIYGIAGAPYLNPAEEFTRKDKVTVDDIIKGFQAQQWPKEATFKYLLLARYYHLHHLCYEGGIAAEGEKDLDIKIEANRDPRIGKIVTDYFAQWYGQGGELFMYYNLSSPWSKYGTWGLTDDIRHVSNKLKAVNELLKGPIAPINRGATLPGTLQAADFDDCTSQGSSGVGMAQPGPNGTRVLASLKFDNTFEYLVNVKEPGVYSFSIESAGPGGSVIEPLLSGTSLGNIALPNTGAWDKFAFSEPVRVHLMRGQLTLRLRVVQANANLRALVFKREG